MSTKQEDLRDRTKQFAFRIIHLFQALPNSALAQVIGKQLLRAGTSVSANYRAAGRARSGAEFLSKMGIVIEEADEVIFWLECLAESSIVKPARLKDLQQEATELVKIFVASQNTARAHSRRKTVSITRSPDRPIAR